MKELDGTNDKQPGSKTEANKNVGPQKRRAQVEEQEGPVDE